MRVAALVVIDSSQKGILEQWARSRSLPARQVERAKVVLLAAEGKSDLEIADRLRIGNQIGLAACRRRLQHEQDRADEVVDAEQRAPVGQPAQRQRKRQGGEPGQRREVAFQAGPIDQPRAQDREGHA